MGGDFIANTLSSANGLNFKISNHVSWWVCEVEASVSLGIVYAIRSDTWGEFQILVTNPWTRISILSDIGTFAVPLSMNVQIETQIKLGTKHQLRKIRVT